MDIIRAECSNCGIVDISVENLEGMTILSEGNMMMSYSCPQCDGMIAFEFAFADEGFNGFEDLISSAHSLTAKASFGEEYSIADLRFPHSIDGLHGAMEPDPEPETNSESESIAEAMQCTEEAEFETHESPMELNIEIPEIGNGQPDVQLDSQELDLDAQSEKTHYSGRINIPTIPESSHDSSGRMGFAKGRAYQDDTQININYSTVPNSGLVMYGIRFESAENETQTYTPSDFEKAQLEYFHRQLEQLGTVDDAIDEIDSGYKPTDLS